MSYDEFARYTPRELQVKIDSRVGRDNQDFERLAQLACWVLLPHSNKPMKVGDLISRRVQVTDTDWDEWAKD